MNNKPTYHRLQHIVNRNSNVKFSLPEIIGIFSSGDYENKNINEKIVVEKFFKECDAEDYEKLLLFDEITAENIKTIYLASLASRSLYRNEWDNLLKLDESEKYQEVEGSELKRP